MKKDFAVKDVVQILVDIDVSDYLDGLAEGKPKWHKVADGDYPPCERGNYSINVLTDCGDIAYYNYDMECWIIEPASVEIDPPIAWCEIPKYERIVTKINQR